ncbi:thiamine phosphate synthase [Labilibaculum sp. A4]|uniref:thiamine phosphate synthase n=1 Tax=Labilibaculum euxinus TaxID=2686357 RepID=UPI000F61ACE4|nr:thiamine phosphate synthase [Labilibaculum euxinus]MDQ1772475.1 thiamine phosphate synthase [Labilibaculum euxinus]MWN78240.1 thiamine phosphate synthase [Labilibaculum euxinus]
MRKEDLKLYLVTDSDLANGKPLAEIIEAAIKGGVSMVQIREKNSTTREFYELIMSVKHILKVYNVPLIVNDRLDIALAVDADGLHIGQSDLPYKEARKILGFDKIIGLSVESIKQAREANDLDVDYIGLSPVFSTQTKSDIAKPLGLDGIKEIASFSKHPCVAIGGINKNNLGSIIEAGADGVALVSAIISQEYPEKAARELKKIIDSIMNEHIE